MNKDSLIKAKQALDEERDLIKGYLKTLQQAEAAIILEDKEIASGGVDCFHCRPWKVYFHNRRQDYAPYTPTNLKYSIKDHTDKGVLIKIGYIDLLVPYNFCQITFDNQCRELFGHSKGQMTICRKQKAKYLKEEKEWDDNDKRYHKPHKYGEYTYHWEECKKCFVGRVEVGTGKYEEDPFSYSDSPRDREIMQSVPCPKCDGTQGVVIVTDKNGKEKIVPCSRYGFEAQENDLLSILADGR